MSGSCWQSVRTDAGTPHRYRCRVGVGRLSEGRNNRKSGAGTSSSFRTAPQLIYHGRAGPMPARAG